MINITKDMTLFKKKLQRQIKIKWEDPGWGTENGYMVYIDYSQQSYTECIGGPFTFKEDAEDFVDEYIDDVTTILLDAGELKED